MTLIDFKDRRSVGPSLLIVISLIALATTLGVMLFVPKPSLAGLAKKYRDMDFKSRLETQTLRERQAEMDVRSNSLLWKLPVAQVGPAAMTQVNAIAKKHKLNVVAFRPQRPSDEAGVGVLPILVSLEGSYPDIAAFVADVEQPVHKLGVNLMQISSADGSTDKVNASVGLVGLQQADETAAGPKANFTSGSKAPLKGTAKERKADES